MSGKAAEHNEAETAFINHSGGSRGHSQASTGLRVQDESVSFPPARTGDASEDAPLLPSTSSRVSWLNEPHPLLCTLCCACLYTPWLLLIIHLYNAFVLCRVYEDEDDMQI